MKYWHREGSYYYGKGLTPQNTLFKYNEITNGEME